MAVRKIHMVHYWSLLIDSEKPVKGVAFRPCHPALLPALPPALPPALRDWQSSSQGVVTSRNALCLASFNMEIPKLLRDTALIFFSKQARGFEYG